MGPFFRYGNNTSVYQVRFTPQAMYSTPHLASHAALTRLYASSLPTTLFPLVWPQRLGAIWSSIMMPAMPTFRIG